MKNPIAEARTCELQTAYAKPHDRICRNIQTPQSAASSRHFV